MPTRATTKRLGGAALGAFLIGSAVAGLLALVLDVATAVDLLQTGLLTVVYVTVPVLLLALLLSVYFKFNAWRQ